MKHVSKQSEKKIDGWTIFNLEQKFLHSSTVAKFLNFRSISKMTPKKLYHGHFESKKKIIFFKTLSFVVQRNNSILFGEVNRTRKHLDIENKTDLPAIQ